MSAIAPAGAAEATATKTDIEAEADAYVQEVALMLVQVAALLVRLDELLTPERQRREPGDDGRDPTPRLRPDAVTNTVGLGPGTGEAEPEHRDS